MRGLGRVIRWFAVFAVLGTVVWLGGFYATGRAISALTSELERAGWEIEIGQVETTGFPDRLATQLTDMRAIAPQGGLVWTVPDLLIDHPIGHLGRVTVTPGPGSNLFQLPYQYSADASSFVVDVSPLPPFALQGIEVAIEGSVARSIGFPTFTMSAFSAQMTAIGDGRYTARTETVDLATTDATPISLVTTDTVLMFDAPLTAGSTPELQGIDVSLLRAVWGASELRGQGDLSVSGDGRLQGQIDLVIEGWQGILDQGFAAGFLTEDARAQLTILARELADTTAGADRIDAPLVFDRGQVFLGPYPLGPAPQLY